MFSIDGKLWGFLSKMADLILVNVFFLVFSIPVITIGASKTALFDVSRRIRRNEEGAIFKNFYYSFKSHFKKSTVIWILYVLSMAVTGVNVYACNILNMGWMTTIFMMASFMIFFIINITFLYAVMLTACGEDLLKGTLVKGCALAVANLPLTMIMIILETMLIILIFFFTNNWIYILTFYVVIGFALMEFICSYFFDIMVKRIDRFRETEMCISDANPEE